MQPFFNLGVPTFFFNLAVVAGSGKKNALQCSHVGHVTLLVLLDLSASFDTVDPDILIHRLQSLLGIHGSVLQWFRSYLRGRSRQVTIKGRTIRKVMGGGVGNFQLARIFFFSLTACAGMFLPGEPLCTNFFSDKYCFFF